MPSVTILGAGVMGSAFSFPLSDAGCSVNLVGTHLDRAWIDSIKDTGLHPKLGLRLPQAVRTFHHSELRDAVKPETGLLVLGVNSAGIGWAADRLTELCTEPRHAPAGLSGFPPILLLTKGLGICGGRIITLADIIKDRLSSAAGGSSREIRLPASADTGTGSRETVPVGAVGGPCIAAELAARRDSSVIIAFCEEHEKEAVGIRKMVNVPYYNARLSTDLIGVEVCAAFKNFYALGVGAAQGFLESAGKGENGALMNNPAAALFTQAAGEIEYLCRQLGGSIETARGLAGVGDLFVTCTAGRNSRMGRLLGMGMRYRTAKEEHMKTDTIEGAELALVLGDTVRRMVSAGRLDGGRLPLCLRIIEAVCDNKQFTVSWSSFFRA